MVGQNRSELRIPADPAYIVVAKRAAAAFAAVAGLHVEGIDDMVIAVAQACQHSIARLRQTVGEGLGEIRLDFLIEGGRLDVQVRSLCSRADVLAARERKAAEAERRRKAEHSRRVAAVTMEDAAAAEIALQLMGLFVDDFGYRLNERTGATHVRLTKYRVA